jgi:hypothetical protein
MNSFLDPGSVGLAVTAIVVALALTAGTVLTWDLSRGWIALRVVALPASVLLFFLAVFVAINHGTQLFQTWDEVWGFVG